ncbi:hypothetical protein M405DRAFT_386730 [Rhizopogon salebrosus TDB-379]|nr:hypothetical protein M405DRAFT_386730 [Rhizopogon salebrosus TDB-379]
MTPSSLCQAPPRSFLLAVPPGASLACPPGPVFLVRPWPILLVPPWSVLLVRPWCLSSWFVLGPSSWSSGSSSQFLLDFYEPFLLPSPPSPSL